MVVWPIVGCFKAHNGIAGCYMIPNTGTANSGITFFTATQRFFIRLAKEGRLDGWAFQRPNGSRATAGDY